MNPVEILKSSSFFQNFKDEYLSRIVTLCQEEIYRARDDILHEGQKAEKLYILAEGSVAIQIHLSAHQDVVLSTIEKSGELFGWSAVVEPRCYSFTIRCLEKATVLAIQSKKLEKLFNDDPVTGLAFMKKIASLIEQRLSCMRKRLIRNIS
jgi:CRP-like cAMP-binding protein